MPWAGKVPTEADRRRQAEYRTPEHKAQVAAVKAAVAAGHAYCWRCLKHLPPGSKAHAGHHDTDRTRYMGAECPPCNLKTAARKAARVANARRKARAPRKASVRRSSRTWQ